MYDFHVHSDYSLDCKYLMDEMIKEAINRNLKAICITDHIDLDVTQNGIDIDFRISDYIKKINQMKYNYGKYIDIYTGVELGLQPHLIERYKSLLEGYKFDFILVSTHSLERERLKDMTFTEDNSLELMRDYYDSVYRSISLFEDFDALSHIDYIDKYINRDSVDLPDFKLYKDKLVPILNYLIENKKSLEFNSSGKRHGLSYYYPKAEILELYRELGGELVTLGSNAHNPKNLIYDFKEAEKILREHGLKYIHIYKERKKYPIHI